MIFMTQYLLKFNQLSTLNEYTNIQFKQFQLWTYFVSKVINYINAYSTISHLTATKSDFPEKCNGNENFKYILNKLHCSVGKILNV